MFSGFPKDHSVRPLEPLCVADDFPKNITSILPADKLHTLDNYDIGILSTIIGTCKRSNSMADAGRKLFNISRTQKSSTNDSHRIKKILEKYELSFDDIKKSD